MPNKSIPEKDQKRIQTMKEKGLSDNTIANIMGYSRPTVKKYAEDKDK